MRGRWAGGEAREQLWPQELEAKTEGKWLCSGRACSCGDLTGDLSCIMINMKVMADITSLL